MKNFLSKLSLVAALGFLCLAAPAVHAQTITQQINSHADAAQFVSTSATTATTITITPPAGQSVYVTGVEITNCAGASAVSAAAVTSITTTNLGGASWTLGSGVSAGLCQPSPSAGTFGLPLKSAAPGTAVTIVLPSFATNQTVRVSAYYYFAL